MRRLSPVRLVLFTLAVGSAALAQTPAETTPAPAPAAAPGTATPAATAAAAGKPVAPPAAGAAPAPAPKAGPNPYSEAIQKGDGSYVARDFDGAIAAYRQEVEKNPNVALGHYRLGEAELAKGDLVEAENAWQAGLRVAGKDERVRGKLLFVLADLKERQKLHDDAIARWKEYEALARTQPDAKGFPATAIERVKRAEEWKKNAADSAEVKLRIEKRIKEADESMKKSSK